MSISPFGLPANYTNNSLYQQYVMMLLLNMQRQAQQQQLFNAQQQALQLQQQQAREEALAAQYAQQQAQNAGAQTTINPTQSQLSPERQQAVYTQYQQPQAVQQPSGTQAVAATTATVAANPNVKDGLDDGYISGKEKCKNFFKGVGNFFKGMVCDENGKFSLKRTLTTVAVAAGAVVLTVATGGAATPFLVAAGATMGAVQVGKGVYKAATAKTDAEAAAAWQAIGSGATAVIGSVAGAKGALKASGVNIPKGPSVINSFKGGIRSGMSAAGKTVTSSLKATAECFKTTGKGLAAAGKGMAHPFQSARAIRGYWKNTVRPNLKQAFSYQNGHKNHVNAMEQKINKNIKDIDTQIKSLNDELATNPSASRVNEINAKIAELTNKRNIETGKLQYTDYRNKQLEAFEKQITDVEAKLADPAISTAEKARLTQLRENLYENYINADQHFRVNFNKSIKNKEDFIARLKEQYKNAPEEGKSAIKQEIELNEGILKGMKEQQKIEVAQYNVERANADIIRLQSELKKSGLTDAQKEAITSRIAKTENILAKNKSILKNSNYKIAARQTLPNVGLAYGTTYLANPAPQLEGSIDDATAQALGFASAAEMEQYAQMNGFANAAQMLEYLQTMQSSQQAIDNADALLGSQSNMTAADTNAQAAAQYTQNPYATSIYSSTLTGQMPADSGLGFNELYVSPYPEMLF